LQFTLLHLLFDELEIFLIHFPRIRVDVSLRGGGWHVILLDLVFPPAQPFSTFNPPSILYMLISTNGVITVAIYGLRLQYCIISFLSHVIHCARGNTAQFVVLAHQTIHMFLVVFQMFVTRNITTTVFNLVITKTRHRVL